MSLSRFAITIGAAAVFALALGGSANALSITFDENGNGVLDGVPITGVLAPDPSVAGHPPALIYDLGANLVGVGDVAVIEFGSDPAAPEFSDWIRFTNADGILSGGSGNLLIFYSACADVCSALADTGFPSNLGSGAIGSPVTETANGTFQFIGGFNTYNGISDEASSVPEPLTISIYGIGLVGAAALRRRRFKAT